MKMLKLLFISLVLMKVANLTDVSYYEILGISKQASTQEIRQAYKKLAIKLHPDKNPNAKDQEVFLKITEAYETLKDPDKRHKYDVYGSYPSYTRRYDYKSQAEYNNLYYNGLYHDDPFVDTLSAGGFYNYLQEGFHFINFYSPFCPPCQNLVDHWKKLAEVYKGIIKFGAVNCKYYNSFCYNSMRIGSYPTLLFYPSGKTGNYMYYRGDRTFDAIDQYVMNHIGSKVHVPTVTQIRHTERPIAYVLGRNRIEENALTRIAFHLNNLVTLVIVEDEALRAKLTENDYATVVFKHKKVTKEIDATEEKDVLAGIVEALPGIERIDPENLKRIRNELRSGHETPWLLYMSTEGDDRLLLNQLRVTLHDFHFGEIDCGTHAELCLSLQAPSGGLAVLKPGGAYQLLPANVDARQYARVAANAYNLHSLSASELRRALDGESGPWVLLVAPYQLPWEALAEPFTATATHYALGDNGLNFGMISCPLSSDQLCRRVAARPAVAVAAAGALHVYSGEAVKDQIVEFVDLILESKDLELTEQQVLEISSNVNRREAWAVAFLPQNCPDCDRLLHQWRIVARKLRPLPNVRVGVLNCARLSPGGFCGNVRAAVARVYPPQRGNHYAVNLQNLAEAPYMLEWALDFLTDAVAKLDWQSFSKAQHSDDRRPWLVYYHSPRCYRCYEMYADFVVAGVLLNKAVNVGKVNCISERGLCQQQHITSYPSLKLYLNKNNHQHYNSVISIGLGGYTSLLEQIEPHLKRYDENLLGDLDDLGVRAQNFHIKHDEF